MVYDAQFYDLKDSSDKSCAQSKHWFKDLKQFQRNVAARVVYAVYFRCTIADLILYTGTHYGEKVVKFVRVAQKSCPCLYCAFLSVLRKVAESSHWQHLLYYLGLD